MQKFLVTGFLFGSLAFTPLAFGEAALWLFPDSAYPDAVGDGYDTAPGYVGEDLDPWLTESYVVNGGEFMLDVYNHGRGNGDNTAYNVQLIIAIDDLAEFSDGTVDGVDLTAASFTMDYPQYSCSGRSIPSHGVFATWYTLVDLGTIAQDEIRYVSVVLNGSEDLKAHFDAFGEGIATKTKGKTTTTSCYDVFNPFSHDVTNIGGGSEPPPPACEYELVIDKEGPALVEAGGTISYTINYSAGASTCDQNNVIITDSLPTMTIGDVTLPALHVPVAPAGCEVAGDLTISCNIGALLIGDSGSISFDAMVSPLLAADSVITNGACIDSAEADQVCDSAATTITAPPINNDAGEDIGTPGFWCSQTGRSMACIDTPDALCKSNQKFTYNQVDGWYMTIDIFSRVFDELGRGATLGDTNALICDASETDTAASKLQRHLMTLWFNLTSHQVTAGLTLGMLCPGPVAMPSGADSNWTVAYVMVNAESVLLAGADEATLLFWKDVVDFIDNAQAPGFCN